MSNESNTSSFELVGELTESPSGYKFDLNKAISEAIAMDDLHEDPSAGSALIFNPNKDSADYNGLWRPRNSLVPPEYNKMMFNSNDLLSTIINQQAHKVAVYCKPQVNMSDVGYKLILRNPKEFRSLLKEKQSELMNRSAQMRDVIYNTGFVNDDDHSNRPKLPEYVKSVVHDGLLFGWTHSEVIRNRLDQPYCFKAVDSGTIYLPPINTELSIKLAQKSFEALRDKKLGEVKYYNILEKFVQSPNSYEFVQVMDGIPYTAFEPGKLIFETFYPSGDVSDAGYPRPPIDSIVKNLSSNSNIATHNNLAFTYGRASKGFFLIKSGGNIQENILQRLRAQFNASINGVERSFRAPVFAIGPNDDIQWRPMEGTTFNGDFQYLSEITSRIIMGAYGVDPSEIPGYSHLVRPNAGQAIAESDNMYLSLEGKGTGFKLCLSNVEHLINKILKIFDPEVSQYFRFKFMGLSEDQPTKKLAQASSALNTYANMNEIMHQFDEDPVLGGRLPLAPQYLNALPQLYSQNEIAAFYGHEAKLSDPTLFFHRDPMWLQFVGQMPELLKNKQTISELLNSYYYELVDMIMKNQKS